VSQFNLKPGDVIQRKDLHRRFGGIVQGGISPSVRTNSIFLFTDRNAAAQLGYYDNWQDGVFNYTGTGQTGDQRLTGLNRSILKHREMGRRLHVFSGSRGAVTYVGEFQVESHYMDTSNDARGKQRRVVVFRLRPLSKAT
jgi:hypothetical protein